MSQIVIDDVTTHTTPKLMMQAIDDNFDELYLADSTNLSTALSRSNHTGTQLASTISNFDSAVSSNTAVAANTAKETNVDTDLSFSRDTVSVTIISSDGNNAVLPVATELAAGVMSAAQVTELTEGAASYTQPWK
jgi:hypothetical protein